jgi:hypothetical protein
MDYGEIFVGVPMMNEVQFLSASEPRKPLKPRSLYVIFLVEKDVCIKGCRTRDDLNDEKIERQYEECNCTDETHRYEEEGRIVSFFTAIRPRNEMVFGIIGVVKFDVVAEELTA